MIKKVKNVAIIGIGYWGEKIKNSIIKNKKFKLSYIADISMSKRNLILKDKIVKIHSITWFYSTMLSTNSYITSY